MARLAVVSAEGDVATVSAAGAVGRSRRGVMVRSLGQLGPFYPTVRAAIVVPLPVRLDPAIVATGAPAPASPRVAVAAAVVGPAVVARHVVEESSCGEGDADAGTEESIQHSLDGGVGHSRDVFQSIWGKSKLHGSGHVLHELHHHRGGATKTLCLQGRKN